MIKFNNETIKNAIMHALDKMGRGIEISEVDRNELIDVILKYGDRAFGINNGNRKYTREELQYSIYIHIFKNDKCYIGQTSRNPKDRWKRNGKGYEGQLVYDYIKKYRWKNISHVVLCHWLTQEQANEMEVALISLFKSNNREFGYNVSNGGNNVGLHSEETINKLREYKKGGNNPRAKAVYCGEMIFQTVIQCAKFYNVNHKTMTYWLKHTDKMNSKFIELGLRDATEEDVKIYPICTKESSDDNKVIVVREGRGYAKKVYCNEMIFKSITQCAKFYNVKPERMGEWLNEKNKTPSKKLSKLLKQGLRYATQEDINTYPLYIEEEQNKQN